MSDKVVNQLKDVDRFQRPKIFRTGSSVEVPRNEISRFPIEDSTDVDYMAYRRDAYVFGKTDRVPQKYRNRTIYRYVTEGVGLHPGYVKVMKPDGSEATREDIYFFKHETFNLHGPAAELHGMKWFENVYKFFTERSKNFISKHDLVMALHSPCWPREAAEWIARQRIHGSPSSRVIKRVVEYGCDFVCISHRLSRNHKIFEEEPEKCNQWRFSFSKAELILIENWTRNQRAVYRTLRVLHKIIQDQFKKRGREPKLCTYYYKTLMLWAVEEKPQSFWDDRRLLRSVQDLLSEMIQRLDEKNLPSYFIPSNNLIDHLHYGDIRKNINALRRLREDKILDVLEHCLDEEFGLEDCRDDEFSSDELFIIFSNIYLGSAIYLNNATPLISNYKKLFTEIRDGSEEEHIVEIILNYHKCKKSFKARICAPR